MDVNIPLSTSTFGLQLSFRAPPLTSNYLPLSTFVAVHELTRISRIRCFGRTQNGIMSTTMGG